LKLQSIENVAAGFFELVINFSERETMKGIYHCAVIANCSFERLSTFFAD
jgi:hypothetical protein